MTDPKAMPKIPINRPLTSAEVEVKAVQDWNDHVLGDPLAVEYLSDETWNGVAIGFFLGYGFNLEAAIKLSGEVEK
jgi:hypothetical protein